MEKKNIEYKIATGKTIKLDGGSLSKVENAPRLCIIGDFGNLIVDKDINGKPNFGETIASTNTSDEKQKLLFAFYNRVYNPKLATHFIVPESQKEYYQSFMKDWLATDFDFISRVREKVVYTIGFCATGDEFEKDLKELKSLKAETDDFTDKLVEMSKKYVWLAKVYNIDKAEAKSLIKQGINIIDSEKYKDCLVDVCASNITVTLYRSKEGYFSPKHFASNFKKSMDAFTQGISNGGKKLKYDFILMNPPYNVGGKITKATLNSLTEDGICVCLMPLAQYKKKDLELWRYVETMNLADNRMFDDATITNNLLICTLRKSVVDEFKTYEEMEMESYDPKFRAFYEVNKPNGTFYDAGKPWAGTKDIFDWNDTWVYLCRAASHGVHSEDALDRRWNLAESRVEIDDIQKPGKDGNGRYSLCAIKFIKGDTRKSCRNLSTWFYAYGKKGLADKLLHSLNKAGGSIEPAIPQIDWETISDHPLWKQGDYDGAVLDVMGLKWNEDKTGVVEK